MKTHAVKTSLVIVACLLLAGCAETKISLGDAKHPPSFRTCADAQSLHLVLTRRSARLDVIGLNHSAPTTARGENITRAGNAASGVIMAGGTAFATGGFKP